MTVRRGFVRFSPSRLSGVFTARFLLASPYPVIISWSNWFSNTNDAVPSRVIAPVTNGAPWTAAQPRCQAKQKKAGKEGNMKSNLVPRRTRDYRSPPYNHLDCSLGSRLGSCLFVSHTSKPPTTRVASPLREARARALYRGPAVLAISVAVLHLTNVSRRTDNEKEEARRKRVKTGERARETRDKCERIVIAAVSTSSPRAPTSPSARPPSCYDVTVL